MPASALQSLRPLDTFFEVSRGKQSLSRGLGSGRDDLRSPRSLHALKCVEGALYGFSVKHIKTKKGRVGKDRLMQGGAPGSYPDCSFARLTVLPRVWTVTGAPYLKGSPHTSLNLGRSPSPPLPFPILTHPPKEVSYGVPLPRRRYR